MVLANIAFDIVEQTREVTQLGNLFYLERVMVEADTGGQVVTPTLRLEATDITLTTFSSSVRDLIEIDVNRIGPFSRLSFTPVLGVKWYLIEMAIRPLTLGLKLVKRGLRVTLPGRSSNIASYLRWDINPFSLPEDARHQQFIVKRVYLDLETGAETVTPVLIFDDGTTESLAATVQASRSVVEYAVLTSKRLRALRIDGDFTNSSVILHDVEIDCYLPSRRQYAVG